MLDPQRIDRRQFAKRLSAASGAAALLLTTPREGLAAEDLPDDKNPTTANADPEVDPAPGFPKSPSQEILLLSVLVQRYPSENFNESALKGIAADLRGDILRGRILSECGLKNSDEPCSIFRAYRGSE
jgi:hypothetical protein